MSMKQNVSFLERCGLTLDKLAEVACASDPREDGDPSSFSVQMLNDVKLSDFRRPSVPTAKGRLELLRVERRGDRTRMGRRYRNCCEPYRRTDCGWSRGDVQCY